MVHLDAAFGEQLLDVTVDNEYRTYQRTASVITSGGKRNPANSDPGAATRRVDLIHSRVPNRPADRLRFHANSARECDTAFAQLLDVTEDNE